MTYLEAVNAVLTRLREDPVLTLLSQDDPVVGLVADFINDAKRVVEDAHAWNGLRDEWAVTTTPGTNLYSLTNAADYGIIEYVIGDDGTELRQDQLYNIRRKQATSPTDNKPYRYAVNGRDSSGDFRIQLYPTPDAAYNFTVYGFRRQADLSLDGDVLLVPSKPVIYYALALAARERGEVGGQTAAEIFSMAKQYLSDAIAYDASLNELDNVWVTV